MLIGYFRVGLYEIYRGDHFTLALQDNAFFKKRFITAMLGKPGNNMIIF